MIFEQYKNADFQKHVMTTEKKKTYAYVNHDKKYEHNSLCLDLHE